MKIFKSNDVTMKDLIGSKWVTAETSPDDNGTIEIVDEKYCIYSCLDKIKLRTYKISKGQIFIGDSVSYAVKDNTFFHNNIPLYIRE